MPKSSVLYEEKKKKFTLISYCQGMPLGHVDAKKTGTNISHACAYTVHLGARKNATNSEERKMKRP
jgi:hypothetical protein